MEKLIMHVTFATKVYRNTKRFEGRFQVGEDIASVLGLEPTSEVSLVIRDAQTGRFLYGGKKKLMSGYEVYGSDLRKCLHPGQRITVEASL